MRIVWIREPGDTEFSPIKLLQLSADIHDGSLDETIRDEFEADYRAAIRHHERAVARSATIDISAVKPNRESYLEAADQFNKTCGLEEQISYLLVQGWSLDQIRQAAKQE